MKSFLAYILLIFVLFGCSEQKSARLTSQEQEAVKKEIRGIVDQILQNVETGNLDAALQPYSNTPEFLAVNWDGSTLDYEQLRTANREFIKTVDNIKFTPVKNNFLFLSKNQVLYTWNGKAEIISKSGKQWKLEPYGVTLLFSRTNGQWKISYSHESALAQPVTIE